MTLGPWMEEMTWTEIAQAVEDDYVPVWVVGATEQHGPHLPLATDTILPIEVVRAAAERLRLLIPPPLPYGYKSKALSGGGQTFPGTMSLDGETLIHVVRDIVAELTRHGFRRIVVFNWHLENVNFVYEGIEQARVRSGPGAATVMSIDTIFNAFSEDQLSWLFDEGFPGWDVEHAAVVETSLVLTTRPELVRKDKMVDDRSEEHPWYDVIPAPPSHIPRSGVLSVATQASAAKGERFQAMLVEHFVEALQKEFAVRPRREAGTPST